METLAIGKSSSRDSAPGSPTPPAASPVPAGATLRDLAEYDDRDLLRIVRSAPLAAERRAAACELLVSRHRNLVWSCVQRYRQTPEPAEDLMQVGYVGLLKAISNFDPDLGGNLAAYAQPCIIGEIKRHFRDKRWQVHVTRSVQERVLAVREATSELTSQLGHTPDDAELAGHLGISDGDLRDAQLADLVFRPCSLDAPLGDRPDAAVLADVLGADDPGLELTLDLQALATHWDELPEREQRILLMRFYGDLTQAEIGQQLGISQMHVSRLLTRSLSYLRKRLLEPQEHDTAA
jgi:RNA polymerase sigma-B factor